MENNIKYQNNYHNFNFKGKRDGEEIIVLVRRHWLILVFNLIPMLFFLLGIIFLHLLGNQMNDFFQIYIDPNFRGVIESFLFMIFWLILFIIWVDYYLDVWIVTDQRIVNIEQLGLFRRRVSEMEHSRIQDVTSKVRGVFPTLFKYGYVYIQTAGTTERFVFKQVPRPVEIRNIIMQLQKKSIREQKREEGAILRGKI